MNGGNVKNLSRFFYGLYTLLALVRINKYKTMEEIIAQLKYDTQNIESKINSIKNTREKMKQWAGKPIYKGCEDSILKWNSEILDHKKMIDEYYKKLSLLNESDIQY